MVNAEKTKLMSQCAIFEKRNAGRDYNALKYSRSDFLRIKSIESFVFSSLGFICLVGLYMFYNSEKFMFDFFDVAEDEFYSRTGLIYLIIILVSQIVTFIVENRYYSGLTGDASAFRQRIEQIKKTDESEGKIK